MISAVIMYRTIRTN